MISLLPSPLGGEGLGVRGRPVQELTPHPYPSPPSGEGRKGCLFCRTGGRKNDASLEIPTAVPVPPQPAGRAPFTRRRLAAVAGHPFAAAGRGIAPGGRPARAEA